MDTIHENLKHLSGSEITEIINLYEKGVKVREIADLYDIQLQHGSLVPLLPPKILDETCPYCQVQMQQKVSRDSTTPYCPECLHTISWSCKCKNCLDVIEEKRKSVRDSVLDVQFQTPSKPESLVHWLYQQTLLKGHIGNGVIKPLEQLNVKLAPESPILDDIQIAQVLYSYGITTISDKSTLSAFPSECDTPTFYINKVYFQTNASDSLPAFTMEELERIRKFIAASEVIEYIGYQIKKVGHDFDYSDTVVNTVYAMLDSFSSTQIFSIVWSSINYSTRCYSERWLKRKDFTSHLMKSCKRYAERALNEGWTVKSFDRPKALPQSVISQLLDDLMTRKDRL
jgi:hypothetical protein